LRSSRGGRSGRALGAGLALSLVAGCSQTTAPACPGEPIGNFLLSGTLLPEETACSPDLPAPGWASLVPPTVSFQAILASTPASGSAALCAGRKLGDLLIGTLTGSHLRVEVTVPGAILSACSATCGAVMTEVVEGDLAAGTGGVTTFQGTLVDQMDPDPSAPAGSCGACSLPCTSTYTLTGTGR